MLNSFPGFCVCVSGWGYVLFASNCYPTCLPHQTVCLISKLNSGELNQTYPNPPVNSQLLNIVALKATSPCTFTPPYCKLRNDSFFTLSSSQDYPFSLLLSLFLCLSLPLSSSLLVLCKGFVACASVRVYPLMVVSMCHCMTHYST